MRKHELLKRIAILFSFNNLIEIVDIFSLNPIAVELVFIF